MDGFLIICTALAIYFAPSIVAEMRGHKKSGGVFTLNLFLGWTFVGWVFALVWAVSGDKNETAEPVRNSDPYPEPEPRKDDELIEAARNIERIVAACQAACPDAFGILVTAASADGKVSRNDLTIIANFCIKQGADIAQLWLKSLNRLNTGINLVVNGDPSRSDELSAISGKPIIFLAGLHGALIALTISNKRVSPIAANLIAKVEKLIQEPAMTLVDTKQNPIEISLDDSKATPEDTPTSEPESTPEPAKPTPFKPQGWVEKARAELAAERKH